MIDNMEFETRALISGKSFESFVLILNFSDNHIITLGHILETPIEISSIEFHPENPNVLTGGCLNGQVIVWDLSSTDHKITNSSKGGGDSGGGDDEDFSAAAGEENEKS
jgi:WD40 repeat protein